MDKPKFLVINKRAQELFAKEKYKEAIELYNSFYSEFDGYKVFHLNLCCLHLYLDDSASFMREQEKSLNATIPATPEEKEEEDIDKIWRRDRGLKSDWALKQLEKCTGITEKDLNWIVENKDVFFSDPEIKRFMEGGKENGDGGCRIARLEEDGRDK